VLNCADLVIIRPSKDFVDSKYLAALFNSTWGKQTVAGRLVGVAQQHFNVTVAKEMVVDLPPLPTQRKIAAILSTYDDLIENNTRRIAILEEMAQAIYREWFVHFRFPGHKEVKLVESELRPVPEGWAVVKLENITTKIGSGATPRGGKNSYKETGISLIRSLNVYDFRFDRSGLALIDDEQASKLSNVIVEPRDILLNITGASVARCCMVPSFVLPARVNQHVSIIRVNSGKSNPFYVIHTLNSHRYKELLLAMAQGGATREALTKSTITNFEIVHPPKDVADKFGAIAEDIFEQQETLQHKNTVLRQTRDLLLPRLISGEVDVSGLEIMGVG
jgi:type I restriction enzyme S subunit